MAFEYDYTNLVRGDSFNAKRLEFPNISGITDLIFVIKKRMSDNEVLYKADLENGLVEKVENFYQIKPFKLNFPRGTYHYEIKVCFQERVKTILYGRMFLKVN